MQKNYGALMDFSLMPTLSAANNKHEKYETSSIIAFAEHAFINY